MATRRRDAIVGSSVFQQKCMTGSIVSTYEYTRAYKLPALGTSPHTYTDLSTFLYGTILGSNPVPWDR